MNVPGRTISRLACAAGLCLGLGCVGPAKYPIDIPELKLLDETTGNSIVDCLVVPRYLHGPSIQLEGGLKPPPDSLGWILAKPFIYKQGDRFEMYEGDSVSLLNPFSYGVLAGGRDAESRPSEFYDHPDGTFSLKPLTRDEALTELRSFRNFLGGTEITGVDRRHWGLGGSDPLHILFTDEERAIVLAYLDNGIGTYRKTEF